MANRQFEITAAGREFVQNCVAAQPVEPYLSRVDGMRVRIVEADVTMNGADGSHVGDRYRLIITLLDPQQYPAQTLIRLYHERWEIETAYLALRHTLLDGHVLRSGDRAGTEQEIWSADPARSWAGKELAAQLAVPPHNLLTQLAEWTRLGFLTRTSTGNYTLDTPP